VGAHGGKVDERHLEWLLRAIGPSGAVVRGRRKVWRADVGRMALEGGIKPISRKARGISRVRVTTLVRMAELSEAELVGVDPKIARPQLFAMEIFGETELPAEHSPVRQFTRAPRALVLSTSPHGWGLCAWSVPRT
jgi:hypothetical protein